VIAIRRERWVGLFNGTPIWFELVTPDEDAAETFYTDAVG
jgi:predicted enzyme related to lactoylglutathione lyase